MTNYVLCVYYINASTIEWILRSLGQVHYSFLLKFPSASIIGWKFRSLGIMSALL